MNPVNVARHSGPDGRAANDVTLAISKGSNANDVVFAIFAQALDRTARISHAPADASIPEAKVPILVQLRPLSLAVFVFPDFRANRLKSLVPLVVGTLHRESPTGNVTKLTFVVFSLIWQTSRADGRVVERDRTRHLQQSNVMVVSNTACVLRIHDDSADGMLDLIRVSLVDIMFANGDSVM